MLLLALALDIIAINQPTLGSLCLCSCFRQSVRPFALLIIYFKGGPSELEMSVCNYYYLDDDWKFVLLCERVCEKKIMITLYHRLVGRRLCDSRLVGYHRPASREISRRHRH